MNTIKFVQSRINTARPEHSQLKKEYSPRLIALEITRRCELRCKHCRAGARNIQYDNELDTSEIKKLLKNISGRFKPIIILTGGDPLLREDVYEIASCGTSLGLKMVMAPCGQLVDTKALEKMKSSGIQRLSFSIDGKDEESHDTFRGVKGSFASILSAMKLSVDNDMEFQVNTTVTRHNLQQLPDILNLVLKSGAVSFHPFLLVPTGRGEKLRSYALDPEEYEKTLNWIYEQKKKTGIQMKPTCAPHYYRIFRQREKQLGVLVTPEVHGMDAMSKGCMGGQSFAFISHTGKVQICGFLDQECGDVRKENYDFLNIWDTSPVFRSMRNKKEYIGKCSICEYHDHCGGCRARAYSVSNNYLAEEPFCTYQPGGFAP